ncbi:MAG: hypothetical protein EOO57_01670 [Hymenobacter sp.]|nr:MAG: hypothetical protein EOO57_01670 [Hymenobacter sp.]
MDSLIDFIQLFTLGNEAATQRIETRLALALRDPAAYQAQYAEELAERGMDGSELPAQELRDVALIDALWSEELAWEADWQDHVSETSGGIQGIMDQQNRPFRPTGLTIAKATGGPEMLDNIQDALEPLGFALVLLPLDSDAYPLSVVAEAQAEDARKLAQELGFGVTVY